jgi:hypothetical protein
MPKKLNEAIINAAIAGFTARKTHLNQRIAELREMLNGGPAQPAAPAEPAPRKRRRLSVAARKRIAEAQRLRWAKVRGESKVVTPATTKATQPKRRISPEGLKRIIAATKKRWRLQRAGTKAKSAKVAKRRGPVRKAA